MKVIDFLRDSFSLVFFYVILMAFISLVAYFDNSIKVSGANILYINIVGLALFSVYLAWEYFKRKRYYDILISILDQQKEDAIASLPDPPGYEKDLYHSLLIKMYDEFNSRLAKINNEKKDYLDFIDQWVHEVKTPISASRLVIQNSSSKSKEQLLDIFENEIEQIENYVEQALYYSRTDSFSKDYIIEDVDADELAKSVIKKLARSFISKRIKIVMESLDFSVTSDKKWLLFILEQILLNSLKYTDSLGTIKISGASGSKEKAITIEDNGIGILAQDIERVFDKGFTGANGRKHTCSTGMGLYLCKALASKLGHDISIESASGSFTRVTVHFPALSDYHKPSHQA